MPPPESFAFFVSQDKKQNLKEQDCSSRKRKTWHLLFYPSWLPAWPETTNRNTAGFPIPRIIPNIYFSSIAERSIFFFRFQILFYQMATYRLFHQQDLNWSLFWGTFLKLWTAKREQVYMPPHPYHTESKWLVINYGKIQTTRVPYRCSMLSTDFPLSLELYKHRFPHPQQLPRTQPCGIFGLLLNFGFCSSTLHKTFKSEMIALPAQRRFVQHSSETYVAL